MFSGILTKLLLAALAASLLGTGVFYMKGKWQHTADQKIIEELRDAALDKDKEIKKKDAEIADLEATVKARARRTRANKEIDTVVSSGNSAAMRRVFVDLGMLPPGGESSPALGPGGGAGRASGAPARAAPVH